MQSQALRAAAILSPEISTAADTRGQPTAPPQTATPAALKPLERAALLALVAGTAAILPGALNRFVFPKLTVVLVGVLLAAGCAARGRLPRRALALLAIAAAILTAAALLGAAPLSQWLGRAPRYEGAIALSVYAGALWAGARLLGPERRADALPWIGDCLTACATLIAAEAVLEAFGAGALRSDVTRPGSLLGNASDEGAWALLALGPLLAVAAQQRRGVTTVGALAAATTLVCSGSRGALAGAVVLLAVVVRHAERPGSRRALIAAGAVLVVAAFAVPTTRNRVLERTPHATGSMVEHELLAAETATLVVHHPLLGVGPGGFVDAIAAEHGRRWEREIGDSSPPDSPESWPLQAAAAGGVPLLLLALALVALTFKRSTGAIRAAGTPGERAALAGMQAALAGYAVALLFHFTSPGTTPLAALFAGALLATRVPAGVGSPARPALRLGRAAAIVAGGCVAVVLAAAAAAEIPLRSAVIDASHELVGQAQARLRLAHELRPWDPDIDATAAHAFAVLAQHGVAGAASRGATWVASELSAWPDSVQGLSDAAALDRALGHGAEARRRLRRALQLDPASATLRRAAAGLGISTAPTR